MERAKISKELIDIARAVRYLILTSTTEAGSGHPTSSMSAAELMVSLMFGGFFRFDLDDVEYPNNDRLIFSKGHAAPLFYTLYALAGRLTEKDLLSLRKFGSSLEGHLTMCFPFSEAATGSLGQGLAIGAGMALNAKYLDKLPYRTYVLMGDSEMAEGSVWETMQVAAFYKLDNLVGIVDVNRLGQSTPTMYGHDLEAYQRRISSFGWQAEVVEDGHDFDQVRGAYERAIDSDRPAMIIAKTMKGKGVSFVEDKEGWHGKPLNTDQLGAALPELGKVDKTVVGKIDRPAPIRLAKPSTEKAGPIDYQVGQKIATREAYGRALVRLAPVYPEIVVLDAEVNNSTHTDFFKEAFPDRFFQMYIAEQNMVGMAVGLSRREKTPFVSTFAAFLSRAFDQIRMSAYSETSIKFAGSHAGVSIGEDGASQMGLEDIAQFRALFGCQVLYPADAVSTEKLVEEAARHHGNVYLRLTRMSTPVLYENGEDFPIGGCKVLRKSAHDRVTVVGAGVTLHEALEAHEELKREGILIRVIDLYSIKPIDGKTITESAHETEAVLTVEDHFSPGGLGEAVLAALAGSPVPVHALSVNKMPKSGRPTEILDYEGISKTAIIEKVKNVIERD